MFEKPAAIGVLSLLLIIGCSKSGPANIRPTDPGADKDAVAKAHDALEKSYRNSNCVAMANSASNDAVFDPPNTPSAKGIDGIRAWCTPLFNSMTTKSLSISNNDIDVSGDIAVDHGDYDWTLTPVRGGAEVRMLGRYVTIWHRMTDGSWKTTRLIWNISGPPPQTHG